MIFRTTLLSAAMALGLIGAAQAATCTVGTCISTDPDGQLLSTGVIFNIDEIVGDGSDSFTFAGYFENDTSGDAVTVATGLGSTLLGFVTDLVLDIVAPAGVLATIPLTGDVVEKVSLAAAPGDDIFFELSGTAIPGTFNPEALPDVNIAFNPAAVPVPAGVLLMGTALAGFGVMRRRRKS